MDTSAYDEAHIPGAIGWAWDTQLCDTVRRDIIPPDSFAELMGSSGISNDTKVVLYGDNNNWFAAWALWQMQLYGHQDVCLMNGGRYKWIMEGRPLTMDVTEVDPAEYDVHQPDWTHRAFLPDVQRAVSDRSAQLVDVRTPDEFTGRILAPPGMPETAQRGGHVPGARCIPWEETCNSDGTFKSRKELEAMYQAEGIALDKPVISYCRIGERSSHTWFVLRYLLGVEGARNYDGSWTEYGNLVGAPIERGS